MSSFSSFAVATSGMRAAQAGLYVMGHNISNLDTIGYTRQSVIQEAYFSQNIGTNAFGTMQVGLGTNITNIRQIRDKFLDASYREENTKFNFHNTKYEVGTNVESILGELQSDHRTQAVISDLWSSINELVTYPSGLETRNNFITTCVSFLDKMQNTYNRLQTEQYNLNTEVKQTVKDINKLLNNINDYTKLIQENEFSGDRANDYRDLRNSALDELSGLLDINYIEKTDGSLSIFSEGKELLSNGTVNKLGFRYTKEGCSFVEPVFTSSENILSSSDTNAVSLYNFFGNTSTSSGGKLKGLLLSRGSSEANYTTGEDPLDLQGKFDVENCTIPKIMKQLDKLFNKIVTAINDAVAPHSGGLKDSDAPYDLNDKQTYLEVFKRKQVDRWSGNSYNGESPNDPKTLYSIGNIVINPVFWGEDAELDTLALAGSPHGIDDNSVPEALLDWWKKDNIPEDGKNLSVDDFYKNMINVLGSSNNIDKIYTEQQAVLVEKTDADRQAIMGVSMDEEMQFMLIYQHAYNAGARVVNVLDSMIETILNL